jgi:hypothetical protein
MKNNYKKHLFLAITLTVIPLTSFAQTTDFKSLSGMVDSFTQNVVTALGTLFMALAVVAFLFGVARYIWAIREGNEKQISDGKQFMLWGLIALFVMFSVYGIVKFAQRTILQNEDVSTIKIPDINFKRSGGGGAPVNPSSAQSPLFTPTTPSESVNQPVSPGFNGGDICEGGC